MSDINHRTVDTNGIKMHFVEAGEGPLVVLCHGFPESWYSWRHQILSLAANGYHVVAPDQRGYGRTDAPEEIAAYTLFHLVGDIVGLVHALDEETAVVVGHDWGAPVAWNAAMWRPDIFRGVVAMSVPLGNRPPFPPTAGMKATFGDNFFYILHFQTPGVAEHELHKDVKRSLRMLLYSASGDNAGPRGGPLPKTAGFLDSMTDPEELPNWLTEEDLDYFTREFQRAGFRGGLNWYRNLDHNWVLSAPFQGMKVNQPALYIIGERDVTRGFLSAEQLREVVPNLTDVVTFPGIGHWTQQENPKGTNEALLKFLDSLG
ncbi:MAG: alpha/beta hydrolase [Gammaproteobacteria bacterium]|nr:alpha/beta hydrolase [Gammaproteobacteria bacterium]